MPEFNSHPEAVGAEIEPQEDITEWLDPAGERAESKRPFQPPMFLDRKTA